MTRKKVEKNLSALHRAGETALKVPTDVVFRATYFGGEDRFWEEAEKFWPREDAPEVTIAIKKEEEKETSLFKPAFMLRFTIKRGSVPWLPIAYESYSSIV